MGEWRGMFASFLEKCRKPAWHRRVLPVGVKPEGVWNLAMGNICRLLVHDPYVPLCK